jgi:hypothetical protein
MAALVFVVLLKMRNLRRKITSFGQGERTHGKAEALAFLVLKQAGQA